MSVIRYATSYGTLYLKGKIEKQENTIEFLIPNTILGCIPFGMNHKSVAISQITSVVKDFRYALEYLFLGLFVAVLGIFMILMNFTVVGVVFIILGFIGILDARKSTLIVSLNSNDHIVISFVRFDRKKADQAYEMINSTISERVSAPNVNRQTDLVIEAIQNDE